MLFKDLATPAPILKAMNAQKRSTAIDAVRLYLSDFMLDDRELVDAFCEYAKSRVGVRYTEGDAALADELAAEAHKSAEFIRGHASEMASDNPYDWDED